MNQTITLRFAHAINNINLYIKCGDHLQEKEEHFFPHYIIIRLVELFVIDATDRFCVHLTFSTDLNMHSRDS